MKATLKYSDLKSDEVFHLVQWMLDPKAIDGAIRSAIHAHGPVTFNATPIQTILPIYPLFVPHPTLKNIIRLWLGRTVPHSDCDRIERFERGTLGTCGSSSAAKRIRGAMKTRVEEYFRTKEIPSTMVSPPESVVR